MLLKKTEKDGVVKALYESSNILASKWDGKDLTVIFKRGATYIYNDVSNTDYVRFETADSQGAVLNAKIKAYSYSKGDDVNEITIINEINEAKDANLKKFEEGMVEYMRLISSAYESNPVLTKASLEKLTEMIIKHSELAGSNAGVKLCACD
jgi:hypothetical protein